MYTIETIAEITSGTFLQKSEQQVVEYLIYDSRAVSFPATSLFFALHTPRQDGHQYLIDTYQKGVHCFIIDKEVDIKPLVGATVLKVANTLTALQQLAAYHRQQFTIPVIGITGSNGKTIVKEWLYQLLQKDFHIIRSPKSYNSQIGVPLSVWQLKKEHTLALFEAGISEPGEMAKLAAIIQPTVGILTNIGEAHSESFTDQFQKAAEKVKLFQKSTHIVYPSDNAVATDAIAQHFSGGSFTWGKSDNARFQITEVNTRNNYSIIKGVYKGDPIVFTIPFIDDASIQNAITCCCILLYLGYKESVINTRLQQLHPVDMRLQLKHGNNNCVLINDSYSADLTSLHIALHFMAQQQVAQNRTVILSDFVETGKSDEILYQTIATALIQHSITKVVVVGEKIQSYLIRFLPTYILVRGFLTTNDLLTQLKTSSFQNETILIKGARRFQFERIVQLLETKVHQTRLEINLNSIAHNLKQYQQLLQPTTKVMVMVKAFAYGSGSAEIASILQFNKVDYLGVAYADEGIALRKGGISVPIMVMNADEASFYSITEYNLQPVLYSFSILKRFEQYLQSNGLQQYPVHLEVETGMNRLGFNQQEVIDLSQCLKENGSLTIESVFTHLAASEDPEQDAFTQQQVRLFQEAVIVLQQSITYPFLKHIANSAAIVRHPQLQWDMVRLGIGIYGIEIATDKLDLQPVATLRSTIAQLKHLKAGESVSYNRKGVVKEPSLVATVRIGYADGYSRRLGNGMGKMWVNGHLAPVIGTVCMDMTMIDVTNVPNVQEGNEVVIFGEELPVQQVAGWAGTIAYEIMTAISQRVKRVYFQE